MIIGEANPSTLGDHPSTRTPKKMPRVAGCGSPLSHPSRPETLPTWVLGSKLLGPVSQRAERERNLSSWPGRASFIGRMLWREISVFFFSSMLIYEFPVRNAKMKMMKSPTIRLLHLYISIYSPYI